MGATIYTYAWAEHHYKKMALGEPVSHAEQHIMMLVYRAMAQRQLNVNMDTVWQLRDRAEKLETDVQEAPEIVQRDGVWRMRVGTNGYEIDL